MTTILLLQVDKKSSASHKSIKFRKNLSWYILEFKQKSFSNERPIKKLHLKWEHNLLSCELSDLMKKVPTSKKLLLAENFLGVCNNVQGVY